VDEQQLKLEILKLAAQIVQPASDHEKIIKVASDFLAWFSDPSHKQQPDNTQRKD